MCVMHLFCKGEEGGGIRGGGADVLLCRYVTK